MTEAKDLDDDDIRKLREEERKARWALNRARLELWCESYGVDWPRHTLLALTGLLVDVCVEEERLLEESEARQAKQRERALRAARDASAREERETCARIADDVAEKEASGVASRIARLIRERESGR